MGSPLIISKEKAALCQEIDMPYPHNRYIYKYIYKYRENMEYNQGFRPRLLIDRGRVGVYDSHDVSKG